MLYIFGILLFSGTDPVSELIKTVTASEYSHCALALRDDVSNKEYCFESTGSFHQIVWQNIRPQVQMHSLRSVVETYSGKVVIRKLRNAHRIDITNYIKPLIGVPYEKNIQELINALSRENTSENPTSLFCSELVAKTLIDNGYISSPRLANNYMPKDFSQRENNLPQIGLRPEKILRRDSNSCLGFCC